jgi:acyl-CoA thioesterase I
VPSVRSLLPATALAGALLLACAGCAGEVAAAGDVSADGAGPSQTASAAASVAPSPSAHPDSGLTVVTIGDSIMAGYGLDPDAAWPMLLGASTGATVVNLACSGAGFVAVGDCDTDFAGLIDPAVEAHPDVVLVQSSDNDSDEDRATIDEATLSTITALRAALPTARIVGLSTLWDPSWEEPDAIDWASAALRHAVHAVGGEFVEIGQPLQGRVDLLQWDEEHPNDDGQIVLSDVVARALDDAGVRLAGERAGL